VIRADVLLPLLALVMMLILVGRRFWSRAVPPRTTLRLALLWAGIIAALWLATALIRG
jgi:O-antigen ligase